MSNLLDIIPESRKDLISLYQDFCAGKNEENFALLEPSSCAKERDLNTFKKRSFASLDNCSEVKKIKIGNSSISWVLPNNHNEYLSAVGLDKFSIKAPCDKRIEYIEKELKELSSLFFEEIKFISEFTSNIIWLENGGEFSLGSAAFYEIPHCTFFSDFAMFSLPPEVIVPKQFAGYAILENLYHEALHHQMHSFAVLVAKGYLCDPNEIIPDIKLSWRDRSFTFLEAIHALHVYSLITPMRAKIAKNTEDSNIENISWINEAISNGLRMWGDLSRELLCNSYLLLSAWSSLINEWKMDYENFLGNSL